VFQAQPRFVGFCALFQAVLIIDKNSVEKPSGIALLDAKKMWDVKKKIA